MAVGNVRGSELIELVLEIWPTTRALIILGSAFSLRHHTRATEVRETTDILCGNSRAVCRSKGSPT